MFKQYYDVLEPHHILVCSAIAGALTSIATNPFWQVQTQVVLDKQRKSIMSYAYQIYEKEGILAFWKGTAFSLLLVLNPVIVFIIYEKLRQWFVLGDYEDPGLFVTSSISMFSKFIATVCTYPLLTLKVKSYTDKSNSNSFSLVINFIKSEGFFALYRGVEVKLLRNMFSQALTMVLFEKLKHLFMLIVVTIIKTYT